MDRKLLTLLMLAVVGFMLGCLVFEVPIHHHHHHHDYDHDHHR